MAPVQGQFRSTCSHAELIFLYVDGELRADVEAELELHTASCADCRRRLNDAKELTLAIESRFEPRDLPEIPADFARRISSAAVNDLSGIRSPRERYVAFAICCLLILTMTAALGGSLAEPTDGFSSVVLRWFALFGSLAQFLYSIVLSITIFLKFIARSGASIFIAVAAFGLSLLLLAAALIRQPSRSVDRAEQS
jgi:hypothetical protein